MIKQIKDSLGLFKMIIANNSPIDFFRMIRFEGKEIVVSNGNQTIIVFDEDKNDPHSTVLNGFVPGDSFCKIFESYNDPFLSQTGTELQIKAGKSKSTLAIRELSEYKEYPIPTFDPTSSITLELKKEFFEMIEENQCWCGNEETSGVYIKFNPDKKNVELLFTDHYSAALAEYSWQDTTNLDQAKVFIMPMPFIKAMLKHKQEGFLFIYQNFLVYESNAGVTIFSGYFEENQRVNPDTNEVEPDAVERMRGRINFPDQDSVDIDVNLLKLTIQRCRSIKAEMVTLNSDNKKGCFYQGKSNLGEIIEVTESFHEKEFRYGFDIMAKRMDNFVSLASEKFKLINVAGSQGIILAGEGKGIKYVVASLVLTQK